MMDIELLNKAEIELSRVIGTAHLLLQQVSTFYKVATKELSKGASNHVSDLYRQAGVLSESGLLQKYLKPDCSAENFLGILRDGIDEASCRTHDITHRNIEAACIVFAHGIVEECIYGYLELTSWALPERWECFIERKKVELMELKEKSFQTLRKQKIQLLVKGDVSRESLPDKLDRLHKVVPPNEGTGLNDYSYDPKHVKKFDSTRHDIVHGNNWKPEAFDFDVEHRYWNSLIFYPASLVCGNSDLKLRTSEFAKVRKTGLLAQ